MNIEIRFKYEQGKYPTAYVEAGNMHGPNNLRKLQRVLRGLEVMLKECQPVTKTSLPEETKNGH